MASPRSAAAGSGARPHDTLPQASHARRRLVLLTAGDAGPVAEILADYPGEEARRVHVELPRLAAQHAGQLLAAEWLAPAGWTRFLWCRL
jgi:hypothetical protein